MFSVNDMENKVSFWSIPVGSIFVMEEHFIKQKPYLKCSEHEFKRVGGKRKWIMFRPNPPIQPAQMVEVIGNL